MQRVVTEWISIAEYDLETAQTMLDSKRYLYVLFMCQQAVEKFLKALYVQKEKKLPPRTHNLLYLVDVAQIKLDPKMLALLGQLNQFYIETRYPGERMQLMKMVTPKMAIELLQKTQEAVKCLKQMFQ